MEKTFYGKVVGKKEGIYTLYVFETNDQYIMCTQLPNWNMKIDIDDIGFVTVEEITAGDKYYDRTTNSEKIYQFSNIYLKNFIKDNLNKTEILV